MTRETRPVRDRQGVSSPERGRVPTEVAWQRLNRGSLASRHSATRHLNPPTAVTEHSTAQVSTPYPVQNQATLVPLLVLLLVHLSALVVEEALAHQPSPSPVRHPQVCA